MKSFENFILKLAETQPNNPLSADTKTLLQCRLNRFVLEYKTPDHLPYSAMIQMALEELNQKKGCSEESISKHLEEKYDNLPSAHSALLKHHLEQLCESGEIVVTCDKRYGLPGCLKLTTRAVRKWRGRRVNKHKLKKRYKRTCEEDEACETGSTENERALGKNKKKQINSLISLRNGEDDVCSEERRSQDLEIIGPPGFELIVVESSPEVDTEPPKKLIGLNRLQRQLKRWSVKSTTLPSSVGLLTSQESNHEMGEPSHDEQKTFDSTPITMEQLNHEDQPSKLRNADVEMVRLKPKDGELKTYGRREKNNSKKSDTLVAENDQPLEVGQDSIHKEKQLCRSSRTSPAKPQDPTFVSCKDDTKPTCRRLKVILRPRPDPAGEEGSRAVNDTRKEGGSTEDKTTRRGKVTLLFRKSKQSLQPPKRRAGRPPKR